MEQQTRIAQLRKVDEHLKAAQDEIGELSDLDVLYAVTSGIRQARERIAGIFEITADA